MSLFDFFRKKEEKESFPSDFALIKVNDVAKSQGINDDHNKIIVRYKNGIPVEVMPYTKSHVEALRTIDNIPVEEEEFGDEEEFEWDSTTTLGVVTYKK